MKPYSNDLRRRIVEAYDSGEHSLAEVAELFSVSLATVKNFVRRNQLTGPPYSPDLSPIERCWSKIKTVLRAIGARTRRRLEKAIKQALSTITESDALAWFAHCGYELN